MFKQNVLSATQGGSTIKEKGLFAVVLNNFTGIFHSFEAEVQNNHFVKQRVKPPAH